MDNYYQPLEKAELVRTGRDVTILCYSRMRYVVMQAVQQLELQGYDPEVHPVHSPAPRLEPTIAGSATFQPVETRCLLDQFLPSALYLNDQIGMRTGCPEWSM